MSVLVALLLAGMPAPPLPSAPAVTAPLCEEKLESLEEMLQRFRNKRSELLQQLKPEFDGIFKDMEDAYATGSRSKLPSLRRQLLELGTQAGPLVVTRIDPGAEPSEKRMGSAREMARALEQLSTRNVSTELLLVFERGTKLGRANALRVLSKSDDPGRVGPVLREHFTNSEGSHRDTLITAIANLGGEQNFRFIAQVLTDRDPKLVKSALNALSQGDCEMAAPMVIELLQNAPAAVPHVPEIVEYFRSTPSVIDSDVCTSLVQFVDYLKRTPRMAEQVLLLLSENEDEWGSKVKKPLKELASFNNSRIAQAAQICLARAGDHRMRKRLLDPLGEQIERNERIASTWQARAELRVLIGDYKGAIKDFVEAQRLASGYQTTSPDIFIGLARCYARQDKLKDAAKWISQGGFGIDRLHTLAKDRDFAALIADEEHRKVFRLDD
jgi:hypothetical protein